MPRPIDSFPIVVVIADPVTATVTPMSNDTEPILVPAARPVTPTLAPAVTEAVPKSVTNPVC